ncbi:MULTISPECIES: flagellar hook-basal body complex protein FliE [Pseudothermotoga]|jgi:flagellar hook-basal body complex protein FliE|uniref:Flagellar hook-basal body complex protein FliE n=1 Tax=Pseudothermotoga lettingae (strain ATCC BAA-301 / DSM 14385 / NBRC 107922 / TMO) TaxID=416591 RepID=A8F3B9_PSELT|nr:MULTISPECIES: flagellar hook-basal body complex protein FliE [Pseudothermotoga]ABV32653.1 flagellar hook-basal body complex subunit FliE [Pseudothermotoga lettingae TMO]KUK20826.1 MAG: Flagellar hook-basal body complex protein FliE [Pseudothermotoga lettingae]MDI3494713.1 flagellar hook-basal body complex protein FliE [Pseudothermotoga sp.]MDK2885088.1 flagellar hook-basal body complex protein FliE [Pseudothermotoga sp.]GLI48356.1 flagellar hook-basal body complex protein FliE [Pseudothermo
MVDKISGINQDLNSLNQTSEKKKSENDFAEIFKSAINKVNQIQKNAEQMSADFALGKISNIHEVIIEAEKASIALKLTTEVRNRIVEAYREIMRMQL